MNLNKKILIPVLISILILTSLVSALPIIDIDIKSQFVIGETVSFNYKITPDNNEQITYIASVRCPNIPLPLLQLKNKSLIAGQITTEEYSYIKIDDTIESQNCSARVSMKEPYKYTVSKNFSIVTNPSFKFNIIACKDESCTEKTKVFVQGEDIFLSYYSEVQNPSLTATLTYPDMTTQQIDLPTAIKTDQTGTYELEVTASKEGYKTITVSDQFGVIKEEAKIETVSGMQMVSGTKENEPRNIETQAAGNETKVVEEIQKGNSIFVITTFAVFIILVIIVISLIFRRKVEKVDYYYSKPKKLQR